LKCEVKKLKMKGENGVISGGPKLFEESELLNKTPFDSF
jgi:hypothetical protein